MFLVLRDDELVELCRTHFLIEFYWHSTDFSVFILSSEITVSDTFCFMETSSHVVIFLQAKEGCLLDFHME